MNCFKKIILYIIYPQYILIDLNNNLNFRQNIYKKSLNLINIKSKILIKNKLILIQKKKNNKK